MIEARGGNAPFYFMRFITAALLIFLSFSASADDYYWYVKGSSGTTHWASPQAGCDGGLAEFKKIYPPAIITGLTKNSETQWTCSLRSSPTGNNYTSYIFVRAGDGCTSPQVYDSSTGMCVTPSVPVGQKCADKDATGLEPIGNSAGK